MYEHVHSESNFITKFCQYLLHLHTHDMYNSLPSAAHKLLIEHIVHDYICVHLSSMNCENPESV